MTSLVVVMKTSSSLNMPVEGGREEGGRREGGREGRKK